MFLPTHNPQKVLHIDAAFAKKTCKVSGIYLATIKEDGVYCYADYHPEVGWSQICSSTNRAIPAFRILQEKLSKDFKPAVPLRMIWEAVIPDTPFHILNGIFNRKYEQAEEVVLVAHDMLLLKSETAAGFPSVSTAALLRWENLKLLRFPKYMRLPYCFGLSSIKADWENWFEQAVKEGNEGIVLKQCNSMYYPGKRNESLMKWKCEVEADLLCTDVFTTIGKKGEKAANLTLQKKDGTTITVVVPKDSEAQRFIQDPGSVLGAVCKIRAMKQLPSGAYREPRFVCIREDKLPTDID